MGVVSRNYAGLVAELGLQDVHVYVPSETDPLGHPFVLRRTDFVPHPTTGPTSSTVGTATGNQRT